MANVNINRSVSDQFYRYKMPRIIAKVEGKGNGIKTVIVNMVDVAKALQRPPTYPTKYFGCELGAQTQFDLKNDRFIVNGSHDAGKLQELLDGFIKKFVLCPECDNPETILTPFAKKEMIRARCIACGYQGNVDMRHRLTTYILKNPPNQELTTTASQTPSKKEKKGKGKNAVNGDGSPEPQKDELVKVLPPAPEYDDDDWGEDTSEAAVQKRMLELSDAAKTLALSEDVEKTPQERIDIFYTLVKRKKEDGTLASSSSEIMAEAERLDIKDKAPLVLVELLFDENIAIGMKTYRKVFLKFCHQNPKAQKYLLGGFEQLVGKVYPDALMPKVPHILKALYDADILEEETIIEWGQKVSKKYVSKEIAADIHERASPFVKWLMEAEEESEESSEEEVEVVYSRTERVGTHTVKTNNNDAKDEEEDDFDIDAI